MIPTAQEENRKFTRQRIAHHRHAIINRSHRLIEDGRHTDLIVASAIASAINGGTIPLSR